MKILASGLRSLGIIGARGDIEKSRMERVLANKGFAGDARIWDDSFWNKRSSAVDAHSLEYLGQSDRLFRAQGAAPEYIAEENYIDQEYAVGEGASSILMAPLRVGESLELSGQQVDPLNGQTIVDHVSLSVDDRGDLRVRIESTMKSEPTVDVRFLYSAAMKGWLGDGPNLDQSADPHIVPESHPRVALAMSAYSAFLADRIIRRKIGRYNMRRVSDGQLEDLQSDMLAKPGHSQQVSECCIGHDMECTDSPDKVTIKILWCRMEVDLTPCCIEHDIALWCGPRGGDGGVDRAYIFRKSADLGSCVLAAFTKAGLEFSFWCGGPVTGSVLAVSYGLLFGILYELVTFAVHLTQGPPIAHWGGEMDHCCLCGGEDPTKCCGGGYSSKAKFFCENPITGEPKYLCNPQGCSACKNLCFFEVGPDGSATAHRSAAKKDDPTLPICPECEALCHRCRPGDWLTPDRVRELRSIPGIHWVEPTPGAPYGQIVLHSRKCPE